MKKFLPLIISLCVISSCNFLRKVEKEKIPINGLSQWYDGTYINRINKYHAIWPLLTNYRSKDSTGTVTFRTLDKNTLLISHSGNYCTTDSFFVKGVLKDNSFRFKRRRDVNGIFPLLYSYQSTEYTLKKNEKGETVLFCYSGGCVGVLIPLMAADGMHNHILKRVSITR